jgi:creatinine amidohydrolase
MNTKILSCVAVLGLCATAGAAQVLPSKWEELTGPEFPKAIQQAGGVCILPFGSVEDDGPSEPSGTNLFVVRIIVNEAVKQEYAVVFPEYFAAQTNDVANLPSAIVYSAELQRALLSETVSEMARNGCRKILIVNGHSGNNGMLQQFVNTILTTPHEYVVYFMQGGPPRMSPLTPETAKLPLAMRPSKPDADGHGGEERSAVLMAFQPEVVHPERAHDETSVVEGSEHLSLPQSVQVGVSRSKEAPHGYIGDASGATAARGRALVDYVAARVVEALRAIKADEESPRLQRQFTEQWRNPIKQVP